jgi:hypothetical protein
LMLAATYAQISLSAMSRLRMYSSVLPVSGLKDSVKKIPNQKFKILN